VSRKQDTEGREGLVKMGGVVSQDWEHTTPGLSADEAKDATAESRQGGRGVVEDLAAAFKATTE
jgi:hypothetical protein